MFVMRKSMYFKFFFFFLILLPGIIKQMNTTRNKTKNTALKVNFILLLIVRQAIIKLIGTVYRWCFYFFFLFF